ncbi:zinc finger BED domain-containing protein 5 [Nephila pilipes]|uniref:Zinc finger BED domain-containing protein 5 n=1 Tax=Nephila pilipes TaxID=299642 RepID=A0A8X6UAK8_NEPPI|nr:zinc finger BED domain-containing protein 5 [Nephila pilipes]
MDLLFNLAKLDIAGLSILLVIVRYMHETAAQEGMLICKSLPTRTTAEEIFNIVNSYFKKHDISWDLCHQVCIDRAKVMLEKLNVVVACMKQNKKTHMRSIFCCIYRQAFAVKKMREELKKVLYECVKIIYFIKSRLFNLLCESMGSLYKTLLLRTNVHWLSHGKVLTRFCELKDEIRISLSEHAPQLAQKLNDEVWIQKVVYLADIFTYFNELNTPL